MSQLDAVSRAVEAIAAGEFVIVVDDEDRENEGDLIIAADAVTAEQMAFMVRHTSGVICCAITEGMAEHLHLPLMVTRNTEAMGTAFTITVDAINDEPSFSASTPLTVNEDSGGQTETGWATFDAGPNDEDGSQTVSYCSMIFD